LPEAFAVFQSVSISWNFACTQQLLFRC